MPRRAAWSALVCAAVLGGALAVAAQPAFADPAGGNSVPDSGSRPAIAGGLQLPGAGGGGASSTLLPPRPAVPGPLGQQVRAEEIAVETLGEQLKRMDLELTQTHHAAVTAEVAWREAAGALATTRGKADAVAGDAYKAATALGPLDRFTTDLQQLSVLVPGLSDQPGGPAAARELVRAEEAERNAYDTYRRAGDAARAVAARREPVKASFDQRIAALMDLRNRNSAALARIYAEQEAYEQQVGLSLGAGTDATGLLPHPRVVAAIQYALRQLGKAYVFGAEGPDHFDCSGLVYAAFRSVGVANMPRLADEQYRAYPAVPRAGMIAGDLIAFGPNPADWRSIHHIGIYLGNGRMLHAPRTTDVVKVSQVWWSEFFGAARVLPAVPAPAATPPQPPAPPTTPQPPPPTTEPVPTTPAPTTSPSPTTTPSATPSPTPTTSPQVTSPPPQPPGSTPATPSATPTTTPAPVP